MKHKIAAGLLITLGAVLLSTGGFPAQREKEEGRRAMALATVHDGGQPWLGVRLNDITAEKARELKLPGEYGVLVGDVEEDSPAAKAGLAEKDVILEFAGERVRSAAQLKRLVRETPPGRSVTLVVSRAGQTRTLNVKLEARPEGFRVPHFEMPRIEIPEIPDLNVHILTGGGRLGISADELTPQLANYFGVKQGKGVLVREVVAGTPAEKAGLKAGDCIVRIGDTDVDSISDVHRALSRVSGEKRDVTLTIVRDRREQTLTVTLEPTRRFSPRRSAEAEIFGIEPKELNELEKEIKVQVLSGEEGVN